MIRVFAPYSPYRLPPMLVWWSPVVVSPICLAFLQYGDGFVQLDDPPSVLGMKTLHEASVQDGASLSPSGGLLVRLGRENVYDEVYIFRLECVLIFGRG